MQRKRCVPNATGKERLRVLLVAALERDLSQVSPSVPASNATDVDTAAASVAVVWAKLNRRTIGHEFCETVRLERKFCQCASPLETVPLQRPAEVPSPPSICRSHDRHTPRSIIRRLSQSRAIALDMESAAIAANGFRFRVPYGTLLCVSDKPLHGEIKLAGMAGEFYRQRVGQHLEIGLRALEKLKAQDWERLHSRKLRSFAEVAFQ